MAMLIPSILMPICCAVMPSWSNVLNIFLANFAGQNILGKDLTWPDGAIPAKVNLHKLLVYSTKMYFETFEEDYNNEGRYDTQHNDIQHNDIQHNNIQHNDIQHNDIQHNDTQHNDTQHNDTQHNNIQHNSK